MWKLNFGSTHFLTLYKTIYGGGWPSTFHRGGFYHTSVLTNYCINHNPPRLKQPKCNQETHKLHQCWTLPEDPVCSPATLQAVHQSLPSSLQHLRLLLSFRPMVCLRGFLNGKIQGSQKGISGKWVWRIANSFKVSKSRKQKQTNKQKSCTCWQKVTVPGSSTSNFGSSTSRSFWGSPSSPSASVFISKDGTQPLSSSQRSNWSKILGVSIQKAKMSRTKAFGTPLGRNSLVNNW